MNRPSPRRPEDAQAGVEVRPDPLDAEHRVIEHGVDEGGRQRECPIHVDPTGQQTTEGQGTDGHRPGRAVGIVVGVHEPLVDLALVDGGGSAERLALPLKHVGRAARGGKFERRTRPGPARAQNRHVHQSFLTDERPAALCQEAARVSVSRAVSLRSACSIRRALLRLRAFS
jgi:hypothetical protein